MKSNSIEFQTQKLFYLGEFGAMADSEALLSICDRVHIVLTRKDTLGEIHLVSSHFSRMASSTLFTSE